MITDIEIYRLETIHGEISDLIDEADAIVAGCDDHVVAERAEEWVKNIRENVQSETDKVTIATTIDDLWNDFYEYGGNIDG